MSLLAILGYLTAQLGFITGGHTVSSISGVHMNNNNNAFLHQNVLKFIFFIIFNSLVRRGNSGMSQSGG